MKKIAWIIALIPFLFAGCETQKKAATAYNDDVYSPPVHHSYKAKAGPADADLSAPQSLADADTSTSKTPASATYDDYNDYSYSARVKRFHHPDQSKDYFDDTYTNPSNYDSTASKDQDVNVYIGSGYGSCCGPSFSFGMGWGYPYSYGWDWGWYPSYYSWYNPWGWYYPYYYYPYYSWGYYPGYWGGYYDWYYGYPYSYSYNTYNGQRRPLSSTNGTHSPLQPSRTNSNANMNAQPKNERTETGVQNPRVSPATVSTRTEGSNVSPDRQRYRYTRPSARQSARDNTSGSNTISQRTQVQSKTQPAPRYTRPENTSPAVRSTEPQRYSSPAYRQPKSSQEYLNPRTGVNRNATPQGRSTNPSVNDRRSSYPAYNNNGYNNSRQSTQPNSGNTRSYSPSTRSYNPGYSQPSRSNNNYSPSRSGGSNYSAPSRSGGGSSGSSGGSRSSGSGSGSKGGRK